MPIVSEAGIGYSIMEGYRLPSVMFTKEEAGSFVAAEKLMQKFTDKGLGSYFESAMYKLKSVMNADEKDWVAAIESQILIDPEEILFNVLVPDALEILFEGIAEKKQVYLTYKAQDADFPTERNVEPVGLFHEVNFWYMMAYCHLRNDYRQFRMDRIQKIERTLKEFTKQHKPVEYYLQNTSEEPGVEVRIRVDKNIVNYIRSGRKFYGFIAEEDLGDQVEMLFIPRNIEDGFARWYLMFGDYAEIIEPQELKERVKFLSKAILENLQ